MFSVAVATVVSHCLNFKSCGLRVWLGKIHLIAGVDLLHRLHVGNISRWEYLLDFSIEGVKLCPVVCGLRGAGRREHWDSVCCLVVPGYQVFLPVISSLVLWCTQLLQELLLLGPTFPLCKRASSPGLHGARCQGKRKGTQCRDGGMGTHGGHSLFSTTYLSLFSTTVRFS